MEFRIVIIILLLILILSLLWHSRRNKEIWSVKEAPLTRINEFPDGAVGKIVGQVVCSGEPLIAPISGVSCAQYQVIISEKAEPSLDGTEREGVFFDVFEDHDFEDFLLKDDTGEALVRNTPFTFKISASGRGTRDPIFKESKREELQLERFARYLIEHCNPQQFSSQSKIWTRWRSWRRYLTWPEFVHKQVFSKFTIWGLIFEERVLETGTKITVYGRGHWDDKQLVMECSKLYLGKVLSRDSRSTR